MGKFAFYFDSSRCTGCKTCELACKDYKDLPMQYAYRRIYDYEGGSWKQLDNGSFTQDVFSYHLSISCNHCDDPACTKACPTLAMHKDKETELVLVDETRCIGCGYCELACPYDAPRVDKKKGHSVKCDACYDRITQGKRPICVESCPLRALDFGEMLELEEKYGEKAQAADFAPLPSFNYTTPSLFINPCKSMRPAQKIDGSVVNEKEVH